MLPILSAQRRQLNTTRLLEAQAAIRAHRNDINRARFALTRQALHAREERPAALTAPDFLAPVAHTDTSGDHHHTGRNGPNLARECHDSSPQENRQAGKLHSPSSRIARGAKHLPIAVPTKQLLDLFHRFSRAIARRSAAPVARA